jgi:hypothetical protein
MTSKIEKWPILQIILILSILYLLTIFLRIRFWRINVLSSPDTINIAIKKKKILNL